MGRVTLGGIGSAVEGRHLGVQGVGLHHGVLRRRGLPRRPPGGPPLSLLPSISPGLTHGGRGAGGRPRDRFRLAAERGRPTHLRGDGGALGLPLKKSPGRGVLLPHREVHGGGVRPLLVGLQPPDPVGKVGMEMKIRRHPHGK